VDSSSAAAAVGSQIGGRYNLRATVGAGGMGTVWKAYDEVLHREVAVKEVTLPPGLPTHDRDLLCERTLREARAAAALNHPAVIKVFDVVVEDDRPWIVMELLDARSLADVVREDGPLEPRTVATVGLAVLGALEAAHAAGILHRDVKPGNVLMDRHGRVTLTDFGVASAPGDSSLTSTGLLLGSPQYIAPERARGQAFGPASDLWSLGATLFAAVEGRAPFDRGDPLPTMTAVVSDPPHPMTLAGPMAPVLTALLTKDPAARVGHAQARAALLAAARGEMPARVESPTVPLPTPGPVRAEPRSRRPLLIGALAALMVVVAAGTYLVVASQLASNRSGTAHRRAPSAAASSAIALTTARLAFPVGSFEVGIPAGWTRAPGGLQRYQKPGAPVWVQFNLERARGSQRAAWEGAAHRAERLDTVFPDYRTVGFPTSTVAGQQAIDWEYSYQRSGEVERRHVLDRGVLVDGISYQLAISAPESDFDAVRGVLDHVGSTFRLTSTP
jgi:hypothetical protein